MRGGGGTGLSLHLTVLLTNMFKLLSVDVRSLSLNTINLSYMHDWKMVLRIGKFVVLV